MFPSLTKEEKSIIASDGKIPVYSKWANKIKEGKIAPDTLLTLAGLASFTSDQEKLDQRIRGIYTRLTEITDKNTEIILISGNLIKQNTGSNGYIQRFNCTCHWNLYLIISQSYKLTAYSFIF